MPTGCFDQSANTTRCRRQRTLLCSLTPLLKFIVKTRYFGDPRLP